MTILIVRCPHCGNQMKTEPKGGITGKKKRCVYCGKSFTIRERVVGESEK